MFTFFRESAEGNTPFVSSVVVLPNISVRHVPLYVDADFPAYGHVRSKLPIVYNIYNRTAFSQEVEVSIEASDAFMFAGHKQVCYYSNNIHT